MAFDKLGNILQPQPAPQPVQPAPQPPPEPTFDFTKEAEHKPKRGGLPISLIADIQKLYQQNQGQPQTRQPVQPTDVGLKGGWKGGE